MQISEPIWLPPLPAKPKFRLELSSFKISSGIKSRKDLNNSPSVSSFRIQSPDEKRIQQILEGRNPQRNVQEDLQELMQIERQQNETFDRILKE